jgi:hypothetical protein
LQVNKEIGAGAGRPGRIESRGLARRILPDDRDLQFSGWLLV